MNYICFQYDKDKDGFINYREFKALIESREYDDDLPEHVVTKIYELSDKNRDGGLDLIEFINMIHHPDLQPIFGHLIDRFAITLLILLIFAITKSPLKSM